MNLSYIKIKISNEIGSLRNTKFENSPSNFLKKKNKKIEKNNSLNLETIFNSLESKLDTEEDVQHKKCENSKIMRLYGYTEKMFLNIEKPYSQTNI